MTTQEPTECGICIESFNKSKRKWVQCPYCPSHGSEIGACITCVKIYLLQDEAPTPRCPVCRSGWTEDFMTQTFTKTWLLNKYKSHREHILLDIERARLPEAQEDAGRYRRSLQILERIDVQIVPLQEQIKNLEAYVEEARLYKEYGRLNNERVQAERDMSRAITILAETEQVTLAELFHTTEDCTDMEQLLLLMTTLSDEDPRKQAHQKYQVLRQQRENLEEQNIMRRTELRAEESRTWRNFLESRTAFREARRPIQRQINALRNREYMQASKLKNSVGREPTPQVAVEDGANVTDRSRWTFVMKCSQTSCEGFVGTNWKCGLCEVQFCKECGEHVQPEHLCVAETRATFQTLRKEAKPCPKCAAMISKIDGCDQMWCTQCQTAFSWRTGQIEVSHVHNPHYFQWMRQNGDTAPLRPVGDCLNLAPEELLEQVNHYAVRRQQFWITEWVRANRHYRWIHRSHQHTLTEKQNDDWRRQLRVKRLVNEITDDAWKDRLQRGEKATQKEYAVVQILDLYLQASVDMLRTTLPDEADVPAILEQLEALRKFCNEEMAKIQKRFNNEIVYFDEIRLGTFRNF